MMWNSTPRHQKMALSVVMVAVVVMAGYLETQSQSHLQVVAYNALQALKLRALAIMEGMEELKLEEQAEYDERQYENYDEVVKYLDKKSQQEEKEAQRDRKKSEHAEHVAKYDAHFAQEYHEKQKRDDEKRLELIANLTATKEDVSNLENEIREREIHGGLCKTRLIHGVCALIGGTASLERQELDEKAWMVRETETLRRIDHQVWLDGVIADFLQGKASQYNQTAQELLDLADAYEAQSQQDAVEANRDNETAQEYLEAEEYYDDRAHDEDRWRSSNARQAGELWSDALRQSRLAYRDAICAMVLSLFGLIYFAPKAIRKGRSLWQVTIAAAAEDDDPRDMRYNICVGSMHVLIFLLVTGLVKQDYLLHLGSYSIISRAVIVIWFASMVGLLQTMVLQTLPHGMASYQVVSSSSLSEFLRHSLGEVALQSLLHWIFVTLFVILEFLILWLTVRKTLFAPSSLHFLSQWFVRLLFPLVVFLHIMAFEPRNADGGSSSSAQPTVLMDASVLAEDDDDKSMPLRSLDGGSTTDESASPTEDLPLIYLGGMRQRLARRMIHVELPAYMVNVRHECCKLAWIFHLLLIICCLSVIRCALPVSWAYHPFLLLVTFLLLPILLCLAFFWRQGKRAEQDLSFSKGSGEKPWFVSKAQRDGYMHV